MTKSGSRLQGGASNDSADRAGTGARVERLEERRLFAAFDVLIFTKTQAYGHDSIDDGVAAIQELGAANDFTVTATASDSAITDENLAQYEVVTFLSTTGDFLNDQQQGAMERYIAAGGGFVGIHGAAAAEYDWAWYGGLLGAFFDDQVGIQDATIRVDDPTHPAAEGLPAEWVWTDELYNFRTNPRDAGVDVLLTLDEDTFTGGTMNGDHPIAWVHEYDGGRSFYTGLGHTEENFSEPLFRQLLLNGIFYAAGDAVDVPTASASADVTSGAAPLAVSFSSAGTDPGSRGPLTFAWDFDDDGTVDSSAANPTFTYTEAGSYTARLVVTDTDGRTSDATVAITATAPVNGAPTAVADTAAAEHAQPVVIDLLANDTDDGDLDPASVNITSQPAQGTVVLNPATGSATYTPAAGFSGVATFSYTVADTNGAVSAPASVTVTVAEPQDQGVLSVSLPPALPVSGVSGQRTKARQIVTVSNTGDSPFNDVVTISLYASADETLETSAAQFASVTRRLRLKAGASKAVPVRVTELPLIAGGDYRVLAKASSAAGESNVAVSDATIALADPVFDLAATFTAAPTGTARAGGRGVAKLLLRNEGNIAASGNVTIAITMTGPEGETEVATIPAPIKLKPEQAKKVKARFTLPSTPGLYTLRATLQASDLGDLNDDNDVATSGEFSIA